MKTETRNALLAGIADQRLNLQTLETRNSDSLDFPSFAIWQVKAALEAAFEAGREAATGNPEGATANERLALELLELICNRASRPEQTPSTPLYVQKVPAALLTKAKATLGSIALEREAERFKAEGEGK